MLIDARLDLVRKYRAHPGLWPDGIDSESDPWYRGHEHEWAALLDKPAVDTAVDKSSVDKVSVDKSVDKLGAVDTSDVDRRKAYQREWIREHRARQRSVVLTSSAA